MEKRFELLDEEEMICRLNELSDENEQLKRIIRHDYEERKRVVNNYVSKIKELEKENEQLKKIIKVNLEYNPILDEWGLLEYD